MTAIDVRTIDRDLISLMSADEQKELMDHLSALTSDKGWPSVYTHRERGIPYRPHNDIEKGVVYNDYPRYSLIKGGEGSGKSVAGIIKTLNRLKRGMNGAMVCVAPETMVNGIPMAERTKPGQVGTLFGEAQATASYLKGKADLFRVVTQSGEQVVVTKDHHFLTPTGWRRLRDLRVGDVIAADDTWRAHSRYEKPLSSQAGCCEDFHLYGEYANHEGQYSQGKWQQPAWLVQACDQGGDSLCRVYTDRFSFQTTMGVCDEGVQQLQHVGIGQRNRYCILQECPELASRFDNLEAIAFHPTQQCWDNGEGMLNVRLLAVSELRLRLRIQWRLQSLVSFCQHQTSLQSVFSGLLVDDLFFSCPQYTTKMRWCQIESVAFSKFGEFYDLTVPGVGHYSAQGLFHHNSPDLVHLQKSLWPEFTRWCPWSCVVEKQRYRGQTTWEPSKPFSLVFNNTVGTQSVLICGGAKESEIGAWEGPNLSFVHLDEFRRHKTAAALKVFDGRVRIPGPRGEPPQIYITTTPRKHWLYEYFGPLKEEDPRAAFKKNASVITLLTTDNEVNLEKGFAAKRAQTLTAAEARVLLMAEWEDVEAGQRFLPSMILWDMCEEEIPSLDYYEPMVIGLDAAVVDDCFAMVGVTRHRDDPEKVAVRFVQVWEPKGTPLDYQGTEENPGPERVLRSLTDMYNVACVVYDPYQLHDMATRLTREGIAWFKKFGQSGPRLEADQQLLSLITQRRLAHDGNRILWKHIDNADRKRNDEGKMRIVKREDNMKVDGTISLSMAAYQCLRLRL